MGAVFRARPRQAGRCAESKPSPKRSDRAAALPYAPPVGQTIRPDLRHRLRLAPEVVEAIAAHRPIVALESTLISHGLPYPQNVAVARACGAAIRAAGATPATVAIHAGRILIGLDDGALEALATAPAGTVFKAARPSLAVALTAGGWAATTVSATMIAADAAGIRVFATGGIGGVHRGGFGARAPPAGSSCLAVTGRG